MREIVRRDHSFPRCVSSPAAGAERLSGLGLPWISSVLELFSNLSASGAGAGAQEKTHTGTRRRARTVCRSVLDAGGPVSASNCDAGLIGFRAAAGFHADLFRTQPAEYPSAVPTRSAHAMPRTSIAEAHAAANPDDGRQDLLDLRPRTRPS